MPPNAPLNAGNMCRYFIHDADFCYKLPDSLSFEEGAMLEPLAVAVYACQRADIKAGSSVLICGAGPIGLLNLLVAKAMGASDIIVTDINDERLKVAGEIGASKTMCVKVDDAFDEPIVDAAIECSGAESAQRLALSSTRSGGRVVLVGMGTATPIGVPLADVFREVDIRGVFRYPNCYTKAIELVASGAVNVGRIITHRFNLENAIEAFKVAVNDKSAIKIMIKC